MWGEVIELESPSTALYDIPSHVYGVGSTYNMYWIIRWEKLR